MTTRYNHVATAPPPVNVRVAVWWHVGEILATWTGCSWCDIAGHALQGPILYWREVDKL